MLEASGDVPRDMRNRFGEIGLRMPDSPVCRMMVELLGEPIVVGSMTSGDEETALEDPDERDDVVGGLGEVGLEHHRTVPFRVGGLLDHVPQELLHGRAVPDATLRTQHGQRQRTAVPLENFAGLVVRRVVVYHQAVVATELA